MSDQHASGDSGDTIAKALAKVRSSEFNPDVDDPNLWLVPEYLQILGHSKEESARMVEEYKKTFMDAEYCRSIGTPVHSEEFIGHEGPAGMAIVIHYYVGLGGDPDWNAYLDWRTEFQKSKAFAEWRDKIWQSR